MDNITGYFEIKIGHWQVLLMGQKQINTYMYKD